MARVAEVTPLMDGESLDSAQPGNMEESDDEHPTTLNPQRPTEDCGVKFWSGPYVAVVAAAFGKVKAKNTKGDFRTLHPVFVLLLALPLFVGQLTMIFALRLDLDVSKGIVEQDDPTANFVLRLKYVMILVLQLTNFSIMLSTTRVLAFVANPVTWIECERPKPKQWFKMLTGKDCDWKRMMNFIFHPWTSAIPCIMALIMRLTISYLVCVDSMSIIFEADSVKDAIFNALVLTFINDLNHIYWEFIEELVHIEEQMPDITILAQPIWAVGHQESPARIRSSVVLSGNASYFPGFTAWLVRWFPFLSRGRGARRFENIVAFCLLFGIYVQQLFVAIFARMTNVLPVARDLCTMYRWKHGEAVWTGGAAQFLFRMIKRLLLIPLDLTTHLKDINPEDNCRENGAFFRMLWSDRRTIVYNGNYTFFEVAQKTEHGAHHSYETSPVHHTDNDWTRSIFCLGAAFILAIMIIPQISTLKDIGRSIFACGSSQQSSTPLKAKEKYEDKAACMKRVEELQKELEASMEKMKQQQTELEEINQFLQRDGS